MREIIEPRLEQDYQMPTKVLWGRGNFEELVKLPEIVAQKGKTILVAGGHFKGSTEYHRLMSGLRVKEWLTYPEAINQSDFEAINALADYVRSVKPDLLVAVGGGTILDAAKCASILFENGGKIEEYVRDKKAKIEKKGVPLVAVPTTAGTGSEVTPWATVWDRREKRKYSLASPLMFPLLAVVDPSLTDSLPPRITAESGIDALTQAIEAFWSVKNNPVSDRLALEAIHLAVTYLGKAVNHPSGEARDMLAKASLLAGLAFSNTETTLCHSVSYPLTAHFGVPHGQAVAITLPKFLEYTLPVLPPIRQTALLEALLASNILEAKDKILSLMKDISLATRLSQLGICHEDISLVVREGFHPDRAKNAPRVPTPDQLQEMLEETL